MRKNKIKIFIILILLTFTAGFLVVLELSGEYYFKNVTPDRAIIQYGEKALVLENDKLPTFLTLFKKNETDPMPCGYDFSVYFFKGELPIESVDINLECSYFTSSSKKNFFSFDIISLYRLKNYLNHLKDNSQYVYQAYVENKTKYFLVKNMLDTNMIKSSQIPDSDQSKLYSFFIFADRALKEDELNKIVEKYNLIKIDVKVFM